MNDVTLPTLSAFDGVLRQCGAKPAHVRKINRALFGLAAWPTQDDEHLPKAVRARLDDFRREWECAARIHARHHGADGESEKLLLELVDGQLIETVLLPRNGVCVSTQIGCAVGCVFCMTGRSGLIRQLTDAEIAAQIILARRLRPETKKVVFMGMGEPSHNLKNVLAALRFAADYGAFGHKNLVISTVGDERLFAALFASDVKPGLAVSLHTVDEAKRKRLLPKGTRMTVDELMDASGRYAAHSGYPVQYEWTLMEGVNDSNEEALQLADRLAGQYAMVNYIPVNDVPGSPWRRPEASRILELQKLLRARGIVATARISAAQEVAGGCGQLRARRAVLSKAPLQTEG